MDCLRACRARCELGKRERGCRQCRWPWGGGREKGPFGIREGTDEVVRGAREGERDLTVGGGAGVGVEVVGV